MLSHASVACSPSATVLVLAYQNYKLSPLILSSFMCPQYLAHGNKKHPKSGCNSHCLLLLLKCLVCSLFVLQQCSMFCWRRLLSLALSAPVAPPETGQQGRCLPGVLLPSAASPGAALHSVSACIFSDLQSTQPQCTRQLVSVLASKIDSTCVLFLLPLSCVEVYRERL